MAGLVVLNRKGEKPCEAAACPRCLGGAAASSLASIQKIARRWLHSKPDSDLVSAVEDFEKMIAGDATQLALGSGGPRHQLDTPIAGAALWANDVGYSHSRKVSPSSDDILTPV